MNLNKTLKTGTSITKEYIVTKAETADSIGNKGVIVLSTPSMIKYMEETASQIVFNQLPKQYSPVGTKICIEHVNPTYIDMKVIVSATLISIDGKKLIYRVEAHNEHNIIGFGEYEQHIINLDHFLNKQNKK